MSRKDVRYLTQQEIPKKVIREYANMDERDFDLFWYGNNFSTSKKGQLYVVEDEKGNVKVEGTSDECSVMLGMKINTFYSYVTKGKVGNLIYRRKIINV